MLRFFLIYETSYEFGLLQMQENYFYLQSDIKPAGYSLLTAPAMYQTVAVKTPTFILNLYHANTQ